MTGAGHSFSDVAMSEGHLFQPWKLQAMLRVPTHQLKPEHANARLVRVESGIRVRELNEQLEQRGYSLENLGGYDGQTIVGAATTGTHGSGLAFGPIASQIASLQLVTTGGEVLQVEPSNGITDPGKWNGELETPSGVFSGARLVQNDAIFNAVLVSLGCMGIVYAIVLRVEPLFWLREVRELTTWSALTRSGGFLDRLLRGDRLDPHAAEDPQHYEVYVNPYPTRGREHACLLTKRYRLNERPARRSQDERKRGRWGVAMTETLANVSGRGDRIVDYMNAHPERVPAIIDDALKSMRDKTYIDVSYAIFNLGPANLIRAYGVELAFDLKQSIAATERHFEIAAELRKDRVMHSSPPSLRFVRRSDALLAMMHGRDTMMLEIGMIVCANDAEELLKTYERRFMDELGARPHWGLDLNMVQNVDQLRKLYPQSANTWLEIYRCLNRRGTFNGQFTDRLGISVDVSEGEPIADQCPALGSSA